MLFQERAWQKSQGKPVGPTVLYFGCRNKAQDYIYQDELEDWEKDGLLTLHTAFSRDQKQKRYVTHCLRETGSAVWDLLDSDIENNVEEKASDVGEELRNEILACSRVCDPELIMFSGSQGSILKLPEEMMCMILQHLPMAAIARMEQTCKHLRTIIIHARIWRKILLTKIEFEPELKAFLPDFSCLEKQEKENYDSEIDSLSYKRLLENLKLKLDYTWMSAHSPNISRTNHVFGELEQEHFLYHIISTGRHFLSFWGPMKTDTKTQRDYIIDVFDRTTLTKGIVDNAIAMCCAARVTMLTLFQ